MEKSIFFNFLVLGLSENIDFWLHIDILCLHSCVMKIVVTDVISCSYIYKKAVARGPAAGRGRQR